MKWALSLGLALFDIIMAVYGTLYPAIIAATSTSSPLWGRAVAQRLKTVDKIQDLGPVRRCLSNGSIGYSGLCHIKFVRPSRITTISGQAWFNT